MSAPSKMARRSVWQGVTHSYCDIPFTPTGIARKSSRLSAFDLRFWQPRGNVQLASDIAHYLHQSGSPDDCASMRDMLLCWNPLTRTGWREQYGNISEAKTGQMVLNCPKHTFT